MDLYLFLCRLGRPRTYLGKILVVTFLGVHIPLIGAIAYLLLVSDQPLASAFGVLAALLVATLVGTAATMAALYALLAPVRAAATAINAYLREKTVPRLPMQAGDEAGVLMANVQEGVTRLDAALDATQARLAAAETESRGTFGLLAALSHELRTPLNHIIGFAEMIATETLGPLGKPEYRGYAIDIGASGGQLLSVLEGVLDLSQAAAAKDALAPALLPLEPQVRAAAGLVHLQAQARGIGLALGIPADLRVYADARALKQMLLHGLSALIEGAAEGDDVMVKAYAQGGAAIVEIDCDGAAWRAEDLTPSLRARLPSLAAAQAAADSASLPAVSASALRLAVIEALAAASRGAVRVYPGTAGGRLIRLALPAVDGVALTAAA